ncbi:MAG: HigA family addiction module antitoxin [Leptolyngbyaceae cyanobacterium bins.302]|nr:HigA family addiction module antitoxin [Leptolyngbyaceae cyanobacterium bins.302]
MLFEALNSNMKNEKLTQILSERKVKPAHPGEVLDDLLEELNLTQTEIAKMLGVSRRTVSQIIHGRRPITVDMAIRLGITFGNGPRLWLNLQQKVDVWDALEQHRDEYENLTEFVSS